MQWMRSLLFVVLMYLVMACMAAVYGPLALYDRRWAYSGIRRYCRWVRATASVMVGLHSEIRGRVPSGRVLICAKHQSFFDILLICSVIERPRFVMKRQLQHMPIIGLFARRIGCISIDRSRGRLAVKQMLEGTRAEGFGGGQLVIYPQGTRVVPGVRLPYKVGASVLYHAMGIECVPAATNVGVFWPRRGIMRCPGRAVVEFLDPIPEGLTQAGFSRRMSFAVETASNRLMREAGFSGELPEPDADGAD